MKKAYGQRLKQNIRILPSKQMISLGLSRASGYPQAWFRSFMMIENKRVNEQRPSAPEVVASYIGHEINLEASHPAAEWKQANPIAFSSDWQGRNPDPARETRVLVLWSQQTLYLRFECRYRDLHVFPDSEPSGRRDHLWDRDVVEAFLQSDPSRERFYREFEVSPNGMWVDLDIFPGGLKDLKSDLERSVFLDEKSHTWSAELAIPLRSLTDRFDPAAIWRTNFFRIEGRQEPRAYLAWQPTHTPHPNFHVPRAFGWLRFSKSAGT